MHFTENHLIFLVFRIALTLTAVINALYISQSKKTVTLKSFIPIIIAYTLYAGLRWGRGVDYNIYYWVYKDIVRGVGREDNELNGIGMEAFCVFHELLPGSSRLRVLETI